MDRPRQRRTTWLIMVSPVPGKYACAPLFLGVIQLPDSSFVVLKLDTLSLVVEKWRWIEKGETNDWRRFRQSTANHLWPKLAPRLRGRKPSFQKGVLWFLSMQMSQNGEAISLSLSEFFSLAWLTSGLSTWRLCLSHSRHCHQTGSVGDQRPCIGWGWNKAGSNNQEYLRLVSLFDFLTKRENLSSLVKRLTVCAGCLSVSLSDTRFGGVQAA